MPHSQDWWVCSVMVFPGSCYSHVEGAEGTGRELGRAGDRQTDVERRYEWKEGEPWLGGASVEIEQEQGTGLHLRCFLYLLAVLGGATQAVPRVPLYHAALLGQQAHSDS